ncbi:hypothetical protein BRARA_B03537 [Brassica rapa]|uniref:Uncharacterized protein n=1 Tax=Brassica campestris TaxID=3711 RepID=A0A398AFK7_BRACM|nr:hypothetical protein BRARA_B03537 [Brassica rapa]
MKIQKNENLLWLEEQQLQHLKNYHQYHNYLSLSAKQHRRDRQHDQERSEGSRQHPGAGASVLNRNQTLLEQLPILRRLCFRRLVCKTLNLSI